MFCGLFRCHVSGMMFPDGLFGVNLFVMLIFLWMLSVSFANDVIIGTGTGNNLSDAGGYFVNITEVTSVTIPTTRIPEHRKLQVMWKNSTTSSIAITWKFLSDPSDRNDTFKGTRVECFYQTGKFISNRLPPWVNTYIFTRLDVDSSYTICINAYERKSSGTIIYPTMQYSKCVILSTIPYVRRDSVIILLCTMSYFIFFSLLGVSQWQHKIRDIKKRRRRGFVAVKSREENQPIKRHENGQKLQCNNTVSAIEETIHR